MKTSMAVGEACKVVVHTVLGFVEAIGFPHRVGGRTAGKRAVLYMCINDFSKQHSECGAYAL